ncbi:MAG: amidohydrolase [Gammaproteobacteria bacterium]
MNFNDLFNLGEGAPPVHGLCFEAFIHATDRVAMIRSLALLSLLIASGAAAAATPPAVATRAAALEPKLIEWRRDLHANPELSNREFRTSARVADHLKSLGLEVRTGIAHTGVAGLLVGDPSGPTVALRADMDALPVTEQTGLPFASTVTADYNGQATGVMHACGHDAHTAILMATAELLASMRDELPGSVLFIFQPAEEGAPPGEEGGAELMLKEGLFDWVRPDAVFGLHVWSPLPARHIGYRAGPIMAAADRFEILVRGRQTHGSQPWGGVDPVVPAAQIVLGLQNIASRQVNVSELPAIISVGSIHGGIRNNIIPGEVTLVGTIRTFDESVRGEIHRRVGETARGMAGAAGASAEVEIDRGYPVTVNDPALTAASVPSLLKVVGEQRLVEMSRLTIAEDFSFYAQQAPGFYFFLGVVPPDAGPNPPANHSPEFHIDESTLKVGLEAMSTLVVDYFARAGGKPAGGL